MVRKFAVKVEQFDGRLRLRWSHKGKRHCLSLGLYDSPLARTVAEGKANIIEADLVTDNFDQSLRKYQREDTDQPDDNGVTVVKMFTQFFHHRAKKFTGTTHQRYKSVLNKLEAFFGTATVATVDEDTADRFLGSLSNLEPITQVQYLGLVNAAWVWGIKQGAVTINPWVEVIKIKVPPQQRPNPFTSMEIKAIVEGFRNSRYYAHYTDFVTFLFGCGCRTGEAVGLQWGHLPEDCSKVWIGESVSGKVRKSTKTNRAREFKLSPQLQEMLLNRRPEGYQPGDLVFPAPRVGGIDARNFRNRAWVTVLSSSGVSYRKPYVTRHSFVSHALAKGINPVVIAQMTGHDVAILFKHYAADIQGGLQCPNIFT
jgi:integrase